MQRLVSLYVGCAGCFIQKKSADLGVLITVNMKIINDINFLEE